jgi:hypothetical protein
MSKWRRPGEPGNLRRAGLSVFDRQDEGGIANLAMVNLFTIFLGKVIEPVDLIIIQKANRADTPLAPFEGLINHSIFFYRLLGKTLLMKEVGQCIQTIAFLFFPTEFNHKSLRFFP